ncbi:cryptochrome/photolyase family protein [Microbulbifer hydrolyticus]|uniref:Cryptochrome/photolyase family protein n=1 Tax=Microbulbifer hydrolyticus TaxID=48074 RepID=A0A6P1TBJ7_9GAMM|nr:cryptochrome/photolyase family protein [Microbulbifer hydrolyticus]MBB5211197.1 deoxyribodipyrimidine photolyase-related protein [Microbulbifer hydrolyticus]QHQ38032.1 cryptochrome/photolyase family protein [Microbulbifer hydrolyticus]
MKTLRLILGDQLNHQHSWYHNDDNDTLYFIAEMRQETDYVKHHIQKVVAFFEAMEQFAQWLRDRGKKVVYYKLDGKNNTQKPGTNIAALIQERGIEKFEYQLPDEYRLDQQLKQLADDLSIEVEAFDTEHFLTTRDELAAFFEDKESLLMESFYRHMRRKHDILMDGDKPAGGKWNFDASNRKRWTGKPEIPHEKGFRKDVRGTVARIEKAGVQTFGNIDAEHFNWPVTREDGLKALRYFCTNLLQHFGDYQDAMDPEQVYLFHSRLSFAMNSKLLHPREVIDAVVEHWQAHGDRISINEVEGFVRQILGWREYMRGVYWREMPGYARCNRLRNQNDLPDFYWTADTKMNCLHHAIKNSLDHAYAHHIQRLMITGNFALLAGVHPDQVDQWYLGIYIDAIEWVEITNTRGMSQYADGGLVATKPYISSGSYINKMSNYCKGCHYQVKEKTGEDACPFNSLYWHFLAEKREQLAGNHRMAMMFSLLDKFSKDELAALQSRAKAILRSPQDY